MVSKVWESRLDEILAAKFFVWVKFSELCDNPGLYERVLEGTWIERDMIAANLQLH